MASYIDRTKKQHIFSLRKVSLSVLTALLSLNAIAEDQTNEDKIVGIEKIEVTAQKRSQNILEVPASLTAFGEEQLVSSGIQNVLDLANFTPGLSVAPARAGGGSLYIRGIGTNITGAGSDPSVAIYHNGAYVSRHVVAFQDFIDVERVEVLRGPQGTLYGRNATGGAINVIDKTPDGSTEVSARLDVGNYDRKGAAFALGGTLVEDKLFGRISLSKQERDSYFTNAFLDNTVLKGEDTESITATLVFQPTDDFKATLRYKDYENDALGNVAAKNTLKGPIFYAYPSIPEEPADPFVVNNDFSPGNNSAATDSLSLELEWDFEGFSLKSITAKRDIDTTSSYDTDGTYLPIGFNTVDEKSEMLSQELQLNTSINENIDMIAGLYYYDEEAFSNINFEFPQGALCSLATPAQDPACSAQTVFRADNTTQAYAAFTEVTYKASEDLRFILGARYSKEEKTFESNGGIENLISDVSEFIGLPAGSYFLASDVVGDVADEDEWSSTTGRFVIQYDLMEDLLLYSSISEGFKSGGFNSTDSGLITSTPQGSYNPEELISYEVGLKGVFFDNRVSGSVSTFLYDYEDLQVRFVDSANDSDSSIVITNAGEAEVLGLEFEGKAFITQDFSVDFMATFLDTEYQDFSGAEDIVTGDIIDLTGESLGRTPDYKFSIGAEYVVDLGDYGFLAGRLEYLKQDEQRFGQSNSALVVGGGYSYGNARLTWSDVEAEWYVAAWVQNFNDDVYEVNMGYNNLVGGTTIYGTPRTYGLTIGYNY